MEICAQVGSPPFTSDIYGHLNGKGPLKVGCFEEWVSPSRFGSMDEVLAWTEGFWI